MTDAPTPTTTEPLGTNLYTNKTSFVDGHVTDYAAVEIVANTEPIVTTEVAVTTDVPAPTDIAPTASPAPKKAEPSKKPKKAKPGAPTTDKETGCPYVDATGSENILYICPSKKGCCPATVEGKLPKGCKAVRVPKSCAVTKSKMLSC